MRLPSGEGDRAATAAQDQPGLSFFRIPRATMSIGGSSAVAILFAIIRNKAVALFLGPEGVGLLGLYTVLLELAQGLSSMGLQSSGARRIAETAGSGGLKQSAITAAVLRKSALMLGAAGMALVLALSGPIAGFTFGRHADVGAVALLSAAVLLRVLAGTQATLLQGARQTALLARSNGLAAVLGTVATIALIYAWGAGGIVPSLVAVTGISLVISWSYARRLQFPAVALAPRDERRELSTLLKLGLAFLASSLLTAAVAYAVRLMVLHSHGAAAVGVYQAAWTVAGLYAGMVLQASGADFYPRLRAACDDQACNRLVNEQVQFGLLLAIPGLLAVLALAPLMIGLFYSAQFHDAANALRWICLGMMLRIIAWPVGCLIVAKGAQAIFFATEVAAAAVHLGLAWWLTPRFGAAGAGAAYLGLHTCHTLVVYCIARRLSGFRLSAANARLALVLLPTATAVFGLFLVAPVWQATAVGMLATLVTGLYCRHALAQLMSPGALPAPPRTRLFRMA